MRAKIALIVVLASFLALSALGVGWPAPNRWPKAPAEPSAATTTTAIPSLQAPACANGLDDDGDGLIDLADPDCLEPTGTSEAPAAASGASAASPVPAPEERHSGPAAPPTGSDGVKRGSTIDGGDAQAAASPATRASATPAAAAMPMAASAPPAQPAAATSHSPKETTAAPSSPPAAPRPRQPDDDDRAVRTGPDRRPQLRHRLLRDPALPAADLPGLRNRIRNPLGGAGLDQQNRVRVRHQPQRLQRRRRRLDAVPALELGNVWGRCQRRRAQRPLQPGRRDLRRRPATSRSPAATKISTTRSSPTTTPTGTCRRCCSTPAPTANCRPTWSAR